MPERSVQGCREGSSVCRGRSRMPLFYYRVWSVHARPVVGISFMLTLRVRALASLHESVCRNLLMQVSRSRTRLPLLT